MVQEIRIRLLKQFELKLDLHIPADRWRLQWSGAESSSVEVVAVFAFGHDAGRDGRCVGGWCLARGRSAVVE